MNRFESKYFNTAQLMNQSLLKLLEEKDYELITIKDICSKAGVNRSTFYLHYENIDDLLKETLENIFKNFFDKFDTYHIPQIDLQSKELDEMIFINEKYLTPYLEYVKENQNILKLFYLHPEILNSENVFNHMFEDLIDPILDKFNIKKEDRIYIVEYYVKGVMAVVMRWVYNGCREEISHITKLITQCVKPHLK